MERRVLETAHGLGGVLGARDTRRLGLSPQDVERLIQRGELLRVRRGAYVLADRWAATERLARDRYRLKVAAVLRSRPALEAASHHAGLAIYGLSFFDVDLGVIDLSSAVRQTALTSGVRLHPAVGQRVHLVLGVRAVPLPTALVQTAAWSGVVAGVCSMDDALHGRRCGIKELHTAVLELPKQHRRRAWRAIELTDPNCESVGESRTRLMLGDLGFAVRSQVQIWSEDGVFLGRVDLVVDDLVVVEFDGLLKYAGLNGRAALAAEKARESAIVDTGREVLRVVWADLDDPQLLGRRVQSAKARALRRGADERGFRAATR